MAATMDRSFCKNSHFIIIVFFILTGSLFSIIITCVRFKILSVCFFFVINYGPSFIRKCLALFEGNVSVAQNFLVNLVPVFNGKPLLVIRYQNPRLLQYLALKIYCL